MTDADEICGKLGDFVKEFEINDRKPLVLSKTEIQKLLTIMPF